ncbi:D-3-phosphoglycerate dehydrogenase 3 [Forsythia ovata]|uniref:D-3-phosphoglycerate dehydrogenase 3 n=1 Tax=Forsythia ovata TaxID=205694 RepID=A0ABD1WV06_9LAMI
MKAAVIGFDKVGSEVARHARGLGMHVIPRYPYAPAGRAHAVVVELEGVAIEITEVVGGVLRGELSATAVNAPMVPPEVLSELATYVTLVEKLGRLAVQLVAGATEITDQLEIQTSWISRFYRVEENVKYRILHLTCVRSFSVDVSLEENLILCCQVDQLSMIGRLGNILGKHNMNVSFMSIGRTIYRTKAIMKIEVDKESDTNALKKIGEVPAREEFVFLVLINKAFGFLEMYLRLP